MELQELLELIDRAATEQWKELDLAGKNLTELPAEIGKLTQLERLKLGYWDDDENPIGNSLTDLPAEIGNLTNLTSLSLGNNQFTKIPAVIAKLTNLNILSLANNSITDIGAEIANLTNLTRLSLHNNQIAIFPEAIGKLTNLTLLLLDHNQIAILPKAIGKLTNLTVLWLDHNQIAILPEAIGKLTNLTELVLSSNQITEIPNVITNLTNMVRLALCDNQITGIPEWVRSFKNLQRLDLRGNPVPIPPEILGHQRAKTRDYDDPEYYFAIQSRRRDDSREAGDLQAILSFYFQTQDPNDTEVLYEAKFIIVGEGDAGKTTLAKKLKEPDYSLPTDEKSTQGIDVIRWDFIQPNGKPFRVNIWDFGGQDIYHATHQFFLTARSLYTLIVDNRRENPNFYYWLNVVRLYSNDSPIFIIKNEKQDRNCELNERQLRSEFLQLKESLATNLATQRGLPEIQRFIQTNIANLPHIQKPIPKTWVKIRNILENFAQNQNYINVERYHRLCKHNGVKDEREGLIISQYLHDLGICLHFQKDRTLKHRVILKPSWATNAVYKVTDTPAVIQNKGRFTTTDLEAIWGDAAYANMQHELLQLMQNFKICYPFGKDTYIAPILLPAEEPDYKWNKKAEHLTLRYKYDFMPKGIITRFIVEMHDKIECLPADNSQLVWRNGVILTNGSTRARIIEDYNDKNIRIRVVGSQRKSFLAIIRHEFQKIHNSYEGLEFKELIPCNCPQCNIRAKPHFYALQDLETRIDKKQWTAECGVSYVPVNIRELIDETIEKTDIHQEPTPTPKMNLRQLVEIALTDDQLLNLCYDFKIQVTAGEDRSQRVRHLVEYVERQGLEPKLLAEIKELNPKLHDRYLTGNPRPAQPRTEATRSPETPTPGSTVQNHTTYNINKVENMTGNNTQNSFGSGDNIGGDKVMGDKINTQINNSQNLAQAAAEIKTLLDQLSEEYNPNTVTGQTKISTAAIEQIKQNPTLKDRVIKAIKEGGAEALKEAIDHPAVTVFIAAFKGFAEGK